VKFWALVGEGARRREIDLEVRMEGGRLTLITGPESLDADVVPLPDGESYSLLVDGRSYEVGIEDEGDALRVTLGGRVYRAVVRSPLEKVLREVRHAAPPSAGSTLRAPMPGLVVAVRIAPGDAVRLGQPLLVMEAMKMQNELAAESPGIVKSLHVERGQSVEAGQLLVTLAPLAAETTP
jgi:biotin carboxyl carrier protein